MAGGFNTSLYANSSAVQRHAGRLISKQPVVYDFVCVCSPVMRHPAQVVRLSMMPGRGSPLHNPDQNNQLEEGHTYILDIKV